MPGRKERNSLHGIEALRNVVDNIKKVRDADGDKMKNGECPVITWDNQEGYGFTAADNFLDYLIESLEEAKENWDED